MNDAGAAHDPAVLLYLIRVATGLTELPDERALAEFFTHMLIGVPGVAGAELRALDQPVVAGQPGLGCAWRGPLVASDRRAGELCLYVVDEAALAPYASLVRGLAELMASEAAGRQAAREGEAARAALAAALTSLEARVVQRTAELREANAQLALQAAAFEHALEGIVVTDASERILSVNRAFTEATGYTLDEIRQGGEPTPRLLCSGRHDAAFYRSMWATVREQGAWSGEVWNRRRSGEVYPAWLSIRFIPSQEGSPAYYVGHLTDLTERKRIEGRLDFLADHDALTGLLTRDGMARRFPEVHLPPAGHALVVLLDLDHFKLINDTHGHELGDDVLVAVAEHLRAELGGGALLCRHSGDEFLVAAAADEARSAAAALTERLLDAVRRVAAVRGQPVSVSASAGVVLRPGDGELFSELLRRADVALQAAKAAGRDTYSFYADVQGEASSRRLRLLRALRGAADRGELSVRYQPQVSLVDGRLVGFEALARWSSPELGEVSPAEFIPLAEAHGLITRIGAWVMAAAFAQAAAWRRAGLAQVPVAVNLSAIQFGRSDLEDTIASIARGAGLPPGAIEVELTESILIQDPDATLARCARLRELGFHLSIDDFGTGFSSLAYLQRLPVDKLKIDRSFVLDLGSGRSGEAIPRAIVQMGHSLGMRVIAEGVEDADTAARLRSLGCDQAQGYHYAPPLSPAQVEDWIHHRGGADERVRLG